jgi:hypothetical protein
MSGGKAKDLTGQVFGRLTVIERVGVKFRHVLWRCMCSCGKELQCLSGTLISNRVHSCGCLTREKCIEKERLRIEDPWSVDMNKYVVRLGYRPTLQPWVLTVEQYESLVTSSCYYCGIPPLQYPTEPTLREHGLRKNGIDRVDSSKGYILENCVPCCKQCNFEKRALSQEDFIENIRRRFDHLSKKGLLRG